MRDPGQTPTGTTPHWSVTFSVADTDAVAARAAELGGTVVVPPQDVEMVRTAVVGDPQGAVFSACVARTQWLVSQFKPN